MIVQSDGLMSQLSNEKVLLLDLFLKRPQSLQLLLGLLEGFVRIGRAFVCDMKCSPKLLELRIGRFGEISEFLFTSWKSSDCVLSMLYAGYDTCLNVL